MKEDLQTKQKQKNAVENLDSAVSIRKLKNIITLGGHGKYSILKQGKMLLKQVRESSMGHVSGYVVNGKRKRCKKVDGVLLFAGRMGERTNVYLLIPAKRNLWRIN